MLSPLWRTVEYKTMFLDKKINRNTIAIGSSSEKTELNSLKILHNSNRIKVLEKN